MNTLQPIRKLPKNPGRRNGFWLKTYLRTVEGESSDVGGECNNPNGVFRLSGLNLATTQLPWFIAHGSPGCL